MKTISSNSVLPNLTLNTIADWLQYRGDRMYGCEAVTQLEHALQCAALAQMESASPELVTAALLHDIGHLIHDINDMQEPHEKIAADMLSTLFDEAVTEPIRMHVDAKRFLCATDLKYWSGLSDMSQRSLVWQGGPFTVKEAVTFIKQPYAQDAVQLRKWDDAAKSIDAETQPLEWFVAIMHGVARTTRPTRTTESSVAEAA